MNCKPVYTEFVKTSLNSSRSGFPLKKDYPSTYVRKCLVFRLKPFLNKHFHIKNNSNKISYGVT